MSGIIGTEWLNSNSLRNYPLSQSATTESVDSTLALPDSLLVDLKLAVPYIAGIHPAYFYISSLAVYPSGFVFEIGYDSGAIKIPSVAISAPVSFAGFSEYSPVSISGVVTSTALDFSQIQGVAIIGKAVEIESRLGTATYSLAGARLESSVIAIGPRRISGVKVVTAGFTTPILSGQLALVSGANHSIEVTGNVIKLNAIDGGGLQADCECSDVELSPCLRTINGIKGDAEGNIVVAGGDCVQVETQTDGITISDSCAKPCCGCNELQVLTTDIDNVSNQLTAFALQLAALIANVNSLQVTCLSSSVDPTSCAQDSN